MMDSFLTKIYTISLITSIIPSFFGILFFDKLNKTLKLNLLLGVIGNILMIISNFEMEIYLKNNGIFYYISLTINALITCLILYSISNKTKFYGILFLVFFYLYLGMDIYFNGIKSNNILPYVFIDIFTITGTIYILKSKVKLSNFMQFFIYTYLIYSLLDIIFSTFTNIFQDFEGNLIFKLFWFGYSSIIQILFSIGICYVIYLARKNERPNFDKIKLFS